MYILNKYACVYDCRPDYTGLQIGTFSRGLGGLFVHSLIHLSCPSVVSPYENTYSLPILCQIFSYLLSIELSNKFIYFISYFCKL
jgi:hypothetical protein